MIAEGDEESRSCSKPLKLILRSAEKNERRNRNLAWNQANPFGRPPPTIPKNCGCSVVTGMRFVMWTVGAPEGAGTKPAGMFREINNLVYLCPQQGLGGLGWWLVQTE